ncbi:MAG: DUF3849 domain-containing protein [Gracilibacteraceae bacterium]|jgi:hypothetical protein|nr:DUF3849 domain-containing protein [Gracilibacteraceae bacterium]
MHATYPVYYPSARWARENGETNLWRESHKINKACKKFIGEKASPAYYDRALPDFINELTGEYGLERAMYVIGRTVMAADQDRRYDSNVRERAARFIYQDMREGQALREAGEDPYRSANNTISIISNVHPCILNDVFRSLMQMEMEQINPHQAGVTEASELEECEIS